MNNKAIDNIEGGEDQPWEPGEDAGDASMVVDGLGKDNDSLVANVDAPLDSGDSSVSSPPVTTATEESEVHLEATDDFEDPAMESIAWSVDRKVRRHQ